MKKINYSIVKSVRGLSHLKKNNPNEDSVSLTSLGNHTLITAISDGHGSDACFRSQTGSRFAVTVFENIFQTSPVFNTTEELQQFVEQVPALVIKQWKELVENDLRLYPYSLVEQSDECKANPYLPYGCTLLGSCITPQYGIFIQIGDGDIFALFSEGHISKLVADDERLTGQAVTSLCLPEAENDFRTSIYDFSKDSLDVIIMGTDGLGNSYGSDENLYAWATDIKAFIAQENGKELINENLSVWLDEVSSNGSADDISMAIIVLDEASSLPVDSNKLEKKRFKKFVSKYIFNQTH